jgi:hypothetical protein
MTAQTWIDRTRDLLLAGTVEPINRINADAGSGVSTLSIEFDAGPIVVGSLVEIGTEQMYVISVAGQSVGVIRGYGGTTAADHSSGDIVRSNPQYPAFQVLNALNDDLNDLSSPHRGLYQAKTTTFTYTAGTDGYNLAADVLGVHSVTYVRKTSTKSEPQIRRFSVRRNRDTATFASGTALILHDPADGEQTVRVEYAAPFTTLTDSTTALSATGLHTEAYDLPPLGAAVKLMSFKPIPRESMMQQGPVRRAEEVPSGAISQSIRDLRFLREQRIQAEAARLAKMYPVQWVRSGQ